jgi:DNA-binding MarR family transcriptional regulator
MTARLTRTQMRALRAVQRMHDSPEGLAHDHEGDLSLTSGNWPATAASLERRGLIVALFDATAPIEEAWTFTITAAGRAALGEARR